jgi:hypothetical protein
MGLTATGWVPAVALAVLGFLLLVASLPRVLRALRRTQGAARTLRTALTGRGRRINTGLAELRAWRAAHRGGGKPAGTAGAGSEGSAGAAGPAEPSGASGGVGGSADA